MSEQAAQPEETAPVQPEQTSATETAPEAPFNPLAEKVAAIRAEILGTNESQEEPEEFADEEVIEPTEEPEAKEDDAEEARQTLAAEKRAREERETLKTEKAAFAEENKEVLESIEQFKTTQANIEFDPLGHLTSSGLSEEALMDLGREIFFKFMPDHATPEIKAEMASLKRERRIAKLERGQTTKATPKAAAKEEPKEEADPAAYAAYETEYKASLSEIASEVDAKAFPLAAEYDAAALEDAMFAVAVQHAKDSPKAGDLSPTKTLEAVEDFLKRNPTYQKKKPAETRPKQPAPRSLRNRTTATRPNTKQPQTFEEKFAAQEAKARAMLTGGKGAQ